MTNNATIEAAISSAHALAITPDDMIALIDKAIAASLSLGTLPVLSMNESGSSMTFNSVLELQSVRSEWVQIKAAEVV